MTEGAGRDRAALEAWLEAIAREGWQGARLHEVAREANLDPARLSESLADPIDALSAFLLALAHESAAGAAAASGSVRDRLFDGIMAGFDRLQANRAAVEAILAARDPAVPVLAASIGLKGVRRLAAAAGVETVGPGGALRVAALAGLLARALHSWRKDDSVDMSATMAALDRLLDEAEKVANGGLRALLPAFPFPGRSDRAPAPAPDPPVE